MKSPLKNIEKPLIESQLQRPNQSHGTRGMAVQVITNHVKLTVPNKDVYMYSAVTDDLFPRERKLKLDAFYKHLISLNHRIYASGNTILSFEPHLDKIYEFPFGRTFNKELQQEQDLIITIQLKFNISHNLSQLSNKADMNELYHICDILIKFDPTFKRLVLGIGQFSTNLFYKPPKSHLLLLKGLQSHTKSTPNGLLLNMDAKYHFLFQPLNLHDAISKSNLFTNKQLLSEFKGIQVTILSNTTKRKNATIIGISDKTALTYQLPELEISVNDYFKQKGIILRYPNDMLICTNKKRNTFYPPELLQIQPNQSYDKPISDINLIRNETCLRPKDRRTHVEHVMKNDLFQIDTETGIVADTSFMTIPARFIQPSQVLFKQGPSVIQNGKVDTRNQLFEKPCKVPSTCVLNFSKIPYSVVHKHLIVNLIKTAKSHGIQFPNNPPYLEYLIHPTKAYYDYEQGVEDMIREAYALALKTYNIPPTILICITPTSTCHVYNHVKRLLETTPIFPTLCLSQFILSEKFMEQRGRVTVNAQYCSNLLLKINEKLSWTNGQGTCAWRLSGKDVLLFINKPAMVLGIDVCHGDEQNRRQDGASVATFVASVNSRFTDYRHVYKTCVNEDTSAVITECMVALFTLFKEVNMCYPDKLIVYRDGLGEGQFNSIGNKEIMGIRAATRELGFEVGLVFISCIKRHSSRFFSINGKDTGRSGNLKSGLVIDKGITSKYYEWYMQSHEGLQGTAIPSRYVVLVDDLKVSGDLLQGFTLDMCHIMQRSCSGCSVPAVIKMADLFAERVVRYNKTQVVSGEEIVLHADLVKRAFYC